MIKSIKLVNSYITDEVGLIAKDLSNLYNQRFNVEFSIVFLSDFLDELISNNAIRTKITSLINSINQNDLSSLNDISNSIMSSIMSCEFSDSQKEFINDAYETIPWDKKVNANQLLSSSEHSIDIIASPSYVTRPFIFPNINKENISETIKKLFAEFYSVSEIVYRINSNIPHEFYLAIIMQKSIDVIASAFSYVSEVLTTTNKLQNLEKIFVFPGRINFDELNNTNSGIDPDFYLVLKDLLKIERSHAGKQKFKNIAKNGIYSHKSCQINDFILNDNAITEMARLTKKINAVLEKKCQIIFTISKNKITINHISNLLDYDKDYFLKTKLTTDNSSSESKCQTESINNEESVSSESRKDLNLEPDANKSPNFTNSTIPMNNSDDLNINETEKINNNSEDEEKNLNNTNINEIGKTDSKKEFNSDIGSINKNIESQKYPNTEEPINEEKNNIEQEPQEDILQSEKPLNELMSAETNFSYEPNNTVSQNKTSVNLSSQLHERLASQEEDIGVSKGNSSETNFDIKAKEVQEDKSNQLNNLSNQTDSSINASSSIINEPVNNESNESKTIIDESYKTKIINNDSVENVTNGKIIDENSNANSFDNEVVNNEPNNNEKDESVVKEDNTKVNYTKNNENSEDNKKDNNKSVLDKINSDETINNNNLIESQENPNETPSNSVQTESSDYANSLDSDSDEKEEDKNIKTNDETKIIENIKENGETNDSSEINDVGQSTENVDWAFDSEQKKDSNKTIDSSNEWSSGAKNIESKISEEIETNTKDNITQNKGDIPIELLQDNHYIDKKQENNSEIVETLELNKTVEKSKDSENVKNFENIEMNEEPKPIKETKNIEETKDSENEAVENNTKKEQNQEDSLDKDDDFLV